MNELAWAAGFFEGEGCVYLDDKKPDAKPHVRLHVGQVEDSRPLERFVRAVGAGKVNGPHLLRGERRRYSVDYYKDTEAVMEKLLPYLGSNSRKAEVYHQLSKRTSQGEAHQGGVSA